MTTDQRPRAVTFGEMLLRLSPVGDDPFFHSAGLCAGFGGCEANVAVGLARLDVSCDYVTVLPDNLIGDAALDALRTAHVGTGHVHRAAGRMGLYFVELGTDVRAPRVVYDRAASAFAAASPATFDWRTILAGAQWFHGSGITPALSVSASRALADAMAAARAEGTPVSIDLNYRPALWEGRDPRPVLQPLVREAGLLIASAGAVTPMLGVAADAYVLATPDGVRDLAAHLAREYACSRVAITQRTVHSATRHGWGASLYDARAGAFWTSHRYEVQVTDRVGGGDSFAAALIAGLLHDQPPERALERAAAAGAFHLTVPGDFPRATRADIDAVIAQWK